jgi:O-methyltransferase
VNLRSFLAARIAHLPPPLKRIVEAAARRLPVSRGWVYDADGLATAHFSPFLNDPEFSRLYDQMTAEWFQDEAIDVRWRMWLLTRYALQARTLPGDYAEFGVYRGGCSRMVLATAGLDRARRLHLFDTFEGIPHDNLTERERGAEFGGRLSDTSVDYVAGLLKPWGEIPRFWPGDVFDTVPSVDTGPLAFVHLDLNAAAPTRHVLEHVYDRLVPGGIVVFDDYGWLEYEDQRRSIDDFLRDRPEVLIALPTGQAVLTKVA